MAHVLEWAAAKLEKVDQAAKVVLKEVPQGERRAQEHRLAAAKRGEARRRCVSCIYYENEESK